MVYAIIEGFIPFPIYMLCLYSKKMLDKIALKKVIFIRSFLLGTTYT